MRLHILFYPLLLALTVGGSSSAHSQSKQLEILASDFQLFGIDAQPLNGEILISALGGVYKLASRRRVPLPGTVFDIEPRLAPDGKRVALIGTPSRGAKSGRMQLFIVDLKGGRRTMLSSDTLDDDDLVARGIWPLELVRAADLPDDWRTQAAIRFPVWGRSGRSVYAAVLRADRRDVIRRFSLSGKPSVDFEISSYEGFEVCPAEDCFYVATSRGIERVTTEGRRETLYASIAGEGVFRPRLTPAADKLLFIRERNGKGEFAALTLSDKTLSVVAPVERSGAPRSQVVQSIGSYAAYGFLRGGSEIVFARAGGLAVASIDGTGSFTRAIGGRFQRPIPERPRVFTDNLLATKVARSLNDTTWAPDGSATAFSALGKIWVYKSGGLQRLTASEDREYLPSFSADGKKILFISWTDESLGKIVEKDLISGEMHTLSVKNGRYYSVRYGHDGRSIVYLRSDRELGIDPESYFKSEFGIYRFDHNTKSETLLQNFGRLTDSSSGVLYPSLHPAQSGRVYFDQYVARKDDQPAYFALKSVDRDGNERVDLKLDTKTSRILVSPDGRRAAAFSNGNLNIYDLMSAVRPKLLCRTTNVSAYFAQWLKDDTLGWSFANSLYRWKPCSRTPPERELVKLSYRPDRADTPIALVNARIVTMARAGVIERGVVVISGGRIRYVGDRLPAAYRDVRALDLRGLTIVPGYIDSHAHTHQQWHQDVSLLPRHKWGYYASLAAGVTTIFDPSADDQAVFAQAELVDSGEMIGPRVFSTGKIIGGDLFRGGDADFNYQRIPSLSEARRILRDRRNLGAVMAKSYFLDEPSRRLLLDAARLERIGVTIEGNTYINLDERRMLTDNFTAIEHDPKIGLHSDWIAVLGASRAHVTLTSGGDHGYDFSAIAAGSPLPELLSLERYRRFVPPHDLASARKATETYFGIGERQATPFSQRFESWRRLVRAGVTFSIGAHGAASYGLHFEMWMLAQAGFSNAEVLEAATINGARKLGLSDQLGSVESGKIADLVILKRNPLEDIRSTRDVKYVMKGGVIYDAASMRQIYPYYGGCFNFPWIVADECNRD